VGKVPEGSVRAPFGEAGGDSLTKLFERQMEGSGNGASLINLIWAPFFDPDYARSLSLGANWNGGPGLP